MFLRIFVVVALASQVAEAAPAKCMVVNDTDRFLIFESGSVRDQRVVDRRAGAIVAGAFTATGHKDKTVLVAGTCKPGDRIKIVETNGKLAVKPLVLIKNPAAETKTKVAEFINRVYKVDQKAADLCFRKPAFAPELLVVGYTPGTSKACSLVYLLGQDANGFINLHDGGFSWPEPFIEAQVARGGSEAERITTTWVREVEWYFTPLETAPAAFASEFAPKFFAPRTVTRGDEVIVEAWYQSDFDGWYFHSRRTHNVTKGRYTSEEVAGIRIEDGAVIVKQPDGTKLRNGKPITK